MTIQNDKLLHNFIVIAAPGKTLYKITGNDYTKNKDSPIQNTTVTPLTAIRVYSIQMCPTLSFTHFRSF